MNNNKIQRKPLEELNLIDNFMFNEMTAQEDKQASIQFCKILIETLLNRKLGNISIHPQRNYQGLDTTLHGICMDVYVDAVIYQEGQEVSDISISSDIYDIEPNCYAGDEPRRMRFYSALMDSRSLQSGVLYSKLKNAYIIMITPYDPFGMASMIYTCRVCCQEIPDMPYDNGITYIHLYTKGTRNIPSQKVADMLSFIEDSSPANAQKQSENTILWDMMERVKTQRKVGIRYMKACEIEEMNRIIGFSEGIGRGIIITGRKHGFTDSEIADDLQSQLDISEEEAYKVLASYDSEIKTASAI